MRNEAFRRYRYVGPEHRKRLIGSPSKSITTPDELQDVLKSLNIRPDAEERTAPYIIDLAGYLRLVHRRSEHVCCDGAKVQSFFCPRFFCPPFPSHGPMSCPRGGPPIALMEAIKDSDPGASKRAFDAMMQMKKIDVATIEAARRG